MNSRDVLGFEITDSTFSSLEEALSINENLMEMSFPFFQLEYAKKIKSISDRIFFFKSIRSAIIEANSTIRMICMYEERKDKIRVTYYQKRLKNIEKKIEELKSYIE